MLHVLGAAIHASIVVTDFHDDEEAPSPRTQREWLGQRTDQAFLSRALPADAYFTAIDVGRSSDARQGQLRKLRGVKAGIPDWLIVWRGITLWIERKAGASLTEPQRLTRDLLIANGHQWRLARSTEQIEEACRSVGIPLRATLGGIRERIADQQRHVVPDKRRVRRLTP